MIWQFLRIFLPDFVQISFNCTKL